MTLKDLLQRWRRPQPHSRPTAIFIDEFDPGLFEGLADDGIVHARVCRPNRSFDGDRGA